MMAAAVAAILVFSGCNGETENEQKRVFMPIGIDASGNTDVTIALNRFFASVPDNSFVCLPAGARYRVEGTILLRDRHGLTIEGHSATIFATTDGGGAPRPSDREFREWPRNRRHWMFIGGSDIVIRNLTVQGANRNAGTEGEAYDKTLEAQHGFEFAGVRGVDLDHVIVTDVYGDFVYLGAARSGGVWTSDVHIHDSHFERNGRQGIAITGAENVLIEHNYIGYVRRSSLDLEPRSVNGGARGIVVRENKFGPGRLLFLASAGRGSQVEDITIESNRLLRPMNVVVRAPTGNRRGPFRILNNVSEVPFGAPKALMRFHRVDDVVVSGNVEKLAATRGMSGVYADESCDVTVENNRFEGAAREAEILPFGCEAR